MLYPECCSNRIKKLDSRVVLSACKIEIAENKPSLIAYLVVLNILCFCRNEARFIVTYQIAQLTNKSFKVHWATLIALITFSLPKHKTIRAKLIRNI